MTNQITTEQPQNVELTLNNDRPMATSMQIAWHFNKRHADVLRAIDNLRELIQDQDFYKRNFALIEVDVEVGTEGQTRKSPAFLLTRDGFSLLGMGFTGKRAMAWKLEYISAFNRMEAALQEKVDAERRSLSFLNLPDESEDSRRNRQLNIVNGMLGFWANQEKISLRAADNLLCAHLNIRDLTHFTNNHFGPAWDFIIQSSCFLRNEGQMIDDKSQEEIEAIFRACPNFKYMGNLDMQDMLTGICGASFDNMLVSDPQKLLTLAWGMFHYSYGFSLGREFTLQEVMEHGRQ